MPEPSPELLAEVRAALAGSAPAVALTRLLHAADRAAVTAWKRTSGLPPAARLYAALQDAAEVLTGAGAALEAGSDP